MNATPTLRLSLGSTLGHVMLKHSYQINKCDFPKQIILLIILK